MRDPGDTDEQVDEQVGRLVDRSWRAGNASSPIGLAAVAPDGRFLRVNHALCRILGRDEATLLATTFQAVTHDDDLAADEGLVAQTAAGTRESYRLTKRYRWPDGGTVWADITVTAVRDDAGRLDHMLSQVVDVSDQHAGRRRLGSLAADLSARARLLERSNADLHAFAASVSHDLQNPLTALRGYLTLLAGEGGDAEEWPPEQRRMLLGRIGSAADQMGDLISSLLEFASIDVDPVTEPVALHTVVDDAVRSLAGPIGERDAEVDVDASDVAVLGSPPLLQTLVVNLVGNALKHGHAGVPPRVRVRTGHAVGAAGGDALVELAVSDDGPGVPDDELGRVTAMFARGSDTVTHGYGIGLSTCRRIVAGHRGELLLARAPEGGLLVRCLFPALSPDAAP